MPSGGVRELTVLSEFKPFGLAAEAADGGNSSSDDYHYFLFDPQVAKQRDEADELDDASPLSSERSDHELFIRGNRIIWSTGLRVYKRFTLPSKVIKGAGLNLIPRVSNSTKKFEKEFHSADEFTAHLVIPPFMLEILVTLFSYQILLCLLVNWSGIILGSENPFYLKKQKIREIADKKANFIPVCLRYAGAEWEICLKPCFVFCKLIDCICSLVLYLLTRNFVAIPLQDPLEDPQITYIEERGKLNLMREFDERTIWTSDLVPLMASYNKGKMQHSLWVVEVNNSSLEAVKSKSSDLIAPGMSTKHSFRRIWQWKGSQTAASKVFLATDDDVTPIICFLLQEQKKLLSLRVQILEINNETVYDIKPDMSWSISAIAAAAVTVTRPKARVGQLPLRDVIALTPESTVLLHSGNLCLCKYILPFPLGKEQFLSGIKCSGTNNSIHDLKIVDLADAVEGRVNIVLNNGQNYRCTLRRSPSSSLTNECITAMSEGLSSSLYSHFLGLLWGDDESTYLANSNSSTDTEWESFCNVITKMCRKPSTTSPLLSDTVSHSSWEYLIQSKYNQQYLRSNFVAGAFPGLSSDFQGFGSSGTIIADTPNTGENFYVNFLTETLDSLHAVYETLKLDNLRRRDLGLLVVLLSDIADFLHEVGYLDHYKRDFPGLVKEFGMSQNLFIQRTPPNLFRWLQNCLQHGYGFASTCDLPPLICKDGTSIVNWARKIVSFYSLLSGADQSGNKLSSGVTCNIAPGLYRTREELTVLGMVGEKFGLQHLDLLPAGVSLPLRHAIDKCRESPPTNWPAAAYVLLGREDLALLHLRDPTKSVELDIKKKFDFEDIDTFEGSVADGMEHIFNSSTQLRYGRDLRLNEVRRLLCSARPVAIQTPVNPTASDQDFQQLLKPVLDLHNVQQSHPLRGLAPFDSDVDGVNTVLGLSSGILLKELLLFLLAVGIYTGYNMYSFDRGACYDVLALAVPKLVLAGRLPAQQNATGKMSRTWILYNKPDEPNVTHAGLLLALGLHGHLRVLTITDIFQYYSQEHESTTVGLMIGLAASYRGTMQPSISKSLYVHLPARHPSSFPELELPTLIQSAALISVGLLYEGSAHPQTMQILLGEIGRRSGGDNVLEREGYAVSAGFSLGLVALGCGEEAIGSTDALVDRLFQYIGGKELHNVCTAISEPDIGPSLFSSSADEHNRNAGQIIDGNLFNIDVTAPGAIIALALMYLKTESQLIVSRLSIPQTKFELQYVRPDFILLRVIARNLIMWSRIHPSEDWIEAQIPEVVKNGVKGLGSDMDDQYEMDAEAFVQAYVNIVVGACISLGLRFAGTRDGNAQELLYKYAIYFLNEIKPVCVSNGNGLPKGLSVYVDRLTLETCLHLIVLSLCLVMAGSGHLQTFRFLKFLRNRNSADGHAYFGTQMAVSLAIGFLFLGGGMWTFSTSNSSVAALLITLYPRLPTGPNDNRCHLQAFRHLYVLATEARWIQTVDVDTGLPVYVPLEVTIKETELYAETSFCEVTPCSLPERAILKAVRVCGPRYWPQVIELCPKQKPWWNSGDKHHPFNSGVLYVKRKVGACSYVDDPIGSQSLLSRAMHKMSGLTQPNSGTANSECTGKFASSLVLVLASCVIVNSCSRSELDFQEFCLQVLFECVSKDRPAMLQVYLSLYTTIGCMVDSLISGTCLASDSLSVSGLKIALAYNEALSNGRLTTSRGEIVQSVFLGSLKKRVEDLLNSLNLTADFHAYTMSGKWPTGGSDGKKSQTILSWYLQWHSAPSPLDIKTAVEKINCTKIQPSIPLLRLVFPRTHIAAIDVINSFLVSSKIED
ncbi:Anaphase-promoting complex subunit [Sesamum angolense]|uniref:Anaphase-promoting complex subunit 1 n=1 Tax=Sesamum angolense TaxID=2727404 RepID=A0AAE1X181_9LAMI|nr:Anaphase-promoting complex subunit [Sesamum angolense]